MHLISVIGYPFGVFLSLLTLLLALEHVHSYLIDVSSTTSPTNSTEAFAKLSSAFGDLEEEEEQLLLQQMVQDEEDGTVADGDDQVNGIATFWWAPFSSPEVQRSKRHNRDHGRGRLKRARTSGHEIRRCTATTFERCLSMMTEVMQNSSLAFPTSGEDLEMTCGKLKEGDFCAEKYIRSCAGDQQRLLYQDIVQGTKNVIRLICQQGKTQQLYLEFASCFKDIFVSEVKCSTVLNRFQEISKLLSAGSAATASDVAAAAPSGGNGKSGGGGGVDEKLKQFCCAYRDVVDCQLKNVRKFCGTRGLDFFERYMGEMTNSLINEHCVGYTFHDKCRPYQEEVLLVDSAEEEDEEGNRLPGATAEIHNSGRPSTRTRGRGKQSRVRSKLVEVSGSGSNGMPFFWYLASIGLALVGHFFSSINTIKYHFW